MVPAPRRVLRSPRCLNPVPTSSPLLPHTQHNGIHWKLVYLEWFVMGLGWAERWLGAEALC